MVPRIGPPERRYPPKVEPRPPRSRLSRRRTAQARDALGRRLASWVDALSLGSSFRCSNQDRTSTVIVKRGYCLRTPRRQPTTPYPRLVAATAPFGQVAFLMPSCRFPPSVAWQADEQGLAPFRLQGHTGCGRLTIHCTPNRSAHMPNRVLTEHWPSASSPGHPR